MFLYFRNCFPLEPLSPEQLPAALLKCIETRPSENDLEHGQTSYQEGMEIGKGGKANHKSQCEIVIPRGVSQA
jgi:hypothetical protein